MTTPNLDTDSVLDSELEHQQNKTGIPDEDNDTIEDDFSNGPESTNTNNEAGDTKKEEPQNVRIEGHYPLSTLLCGVHFAALQGLAGKQVKNITMTDFEYPEHLKPALEDALMKVAPAIMNNPYVIIGGILFIHTQQMIALSKTRES